MRKILFNTHNTKQHGYIALMAAIIISLILTSMTITFSASGFFTRLNVLNTEYKRISLGLAESCANSALLKIAQNYSYGGNESINIQEGSDPQNCDIKAVEYGSEDSDHQKTATIVTKANFHGAFSSIQVGAVVQNPTVARVVKATLTVIVQVINNYGGSKQANDFTVSIIGGDPSQTSFQGSSSGTVVFVNPGTFGVTGNNLTNYIQSITGNCGGTITATTPLTCTIVENDIPTSATLTVIANIINDNGGTLLPSDFSLTIDGTSQPSGSPRSGLTAGVHTVSAADHSGYTASSWSSGCENGSVSLSAGTSKTCTIVFDDIPPPTPACADTVSILDRTGSMSSADKTNEATASKALIDLYKTVTPAPKVGVGSFGAYPNGGAASVPTSPSGLLTNVYGSNSGSNSTALLSPTASASPSQWTDPDYGRLNDAVFTTSFTNNQTQGYKFDDLPVPSGAAITGIEAVVDGQATLINTATSGLVPSAIGNYNSWTGNPTNNNSGKLTDVSANDSTNYISTSTQNNAQTFVVPNSAIPAGSTINSVILFAVAKYSTAGAAVKLRVENGTTSGHRRDGSNISLTDTFSTYSWVMDTNPITSSAWTLAEVNAWTTRFGVIKSNSSGTAEVDQIYVIVNYTPSGSLGINLSWNNGTTLTAQKTTSLTSTEAPYTLGSSSDTWGHTWTVPADISNTNFLLRLKNLSATGVTVSVNYITLKVYYTTPSSGLYLTLNTITASSSSVGTDLSAAITAGNNELSSSRHDPEKTKVLILISDGVPNKPSGVLSTDSQSALNAADTAKLAGTEIFTIHFGDTSGRDLLAKLASGSVAVSGHQPGSKNDAGTSTNLSVMEAENNDGDNFFIAPTSADMPNIFNTISNIACPAIAAPPPAVPTQGTIIVITHVVNDNGGISTASDFMMNISATNPSQTSFAGSELPGVAVAVDPGSYSVDEGSTGAYSKILSSGCSGTISTGSILTCIVTNDDLPPSSSTPSSPPLPSNITINSWQEKPY